MYWEDAMKRCEEMNKKLEDRVQDGKIFYLIKW